jgi:hypothetical protein
VSNTCSRCGATVAPENTVCSACGAPVAAPVVPPPVSYAAAPPVPPPVSYTAAPGVPVPVPAAKGGGALKIILIVVGIFVAIGVLAACVVGYGVYRVSKAVHVDNNGTATVETANGKMSIGSDSTIGAAELGVDIYPGAAHAPGSLNFKGPDGATATANFTTSDSVSQVVDFYKDKLGANATTMETGGGTILASNSSDRNNSVMVTVASQAGKTKFSIVHSTKTK